MIRIERDDPLRLLGQLPAGWAQTVITGPPSNPAGSGHTRHEAELLKVVGELARVSRPNGTLLWNTAPEQPLPLRQLTWVFLLAGGWHLRKSDLAARCGYLLFSKQPQYHWQPQRPVRPLRVRTAGARRAWCIPAEDDRQRLRLQRLLLAATTQIACGACGAPWSRTTQRARRGVPMRCGHQNPHGRCLVIDPFHVPDSPLPGIALAQRRSYLGILANPVEVRR